MSRCYLEVPGDAGTRQVPLESAPVTLGRAETNTLAFPSDPSVSRLHAVIEQDGERWRIRDAGSSNGTYVNDQPLNGERTLAGGDQIELGSSRLVFRDGGASSGAPAAAYLDLTEEFRDRVPVTPPPAPSAARPAPAAPPAPTAPAAAPGAQSPQPARGQGSAHFRGTARAVQTRRDDNQREILVFRVERYDDAGNRLAPVAVEFRNFSGGMLNDGEEVEVSGRWSRGTVKASSVTNLSTGSELRGMAVWMKVLFTIFTLFFIAFFTFLIYSIVSGP